MNTKVMTYGFTSALFVLAFGAMLLMTPGTAAAHDGEDHSTSAEARAHLLERGRNTNRASTTVDATCMAGAVETRETALQSAWSELDTSITGALTDRKASLIAAWNMSSASERNTALRAAWKEWKADKKAAHTEFRKDRKAAWDAFKKTAKESCKMTVPKDEALEKTEKDTVSI